LREPASRKYAAAGVGAVVRAIVPPRDNRLDGAGLPAIMGTAVAGAAAAPARQGGFHPRSIDRE